MISTSQLPWAAGGAWMVHRGDGCWCQVTAKLLRTLARPVRVLRRLRGGLRLAKGILVGIGFEAPHLSRPVAALFRPVLASSSRDGVVVARPPNATEVAGLATRARMRPAMSTVRDGLSYSPGAGQVSR